MSNAPQPSWKVALSVPAGMVIGCAFMALHHWAHLPLWLTIGIPVVAFTICLALALASARRR